MKTILVTWGTWFLWSQLIDKLLKNKYEVILLKRSFSNLDNIKSNLGNSLLKSYNIDQINIEDIFKNNKIDCIFHSATSYWRKNEKIIDIVETNLLFPLKLLELSTIYNVNNFYNVDTTLPQWLNYYVMSKKQLLEYAKKMTTNHNINFVNLMLEHIYWPWDDESKFIWMIISKILNNEKYIDLTIWEQERDFIYIEDVINIFLKLLKTNHKWFHEYEIWTWKTIKIKDLVEQIKKLLNSNILLNFWKINYRKWEQMFSCADMKIDFNFTSIEKWLINTINYFKNK